MKRWLLAIAACLLFLSSAQAEISSPELEAIARNYQQRVTAKAARDTRSSLDLLRQVREAMLVEKFGRAVELLEVLAGRNDGHAAGGARTWTRLALAWQASTAAERQDTPRAEMLAAAYKGYKEAATDSDRIEALSLLGSFLWRAAALPAEADEGGKRLVEESVKSEPVENREAARRLAYQVFAELGKLAGSERYAEQIKRLEAPFLLEHVTFPPPPVASDKYIRDQCERWQKQSAAPRQPKPEQEAEDTDGPLIFSTDKAECRASARNEACLVFSRVLDPKIDQVARSITVEIMDKDPAAGDDQDVAYPSSLKDKEVCYGNLRFGAQYQFKIDQSLRAVDGALLDRPAVALIKMPDYLPNIGFKRGSYVLPANGPGTILMRSVNVAQADLKIRRIGDRSLMQEVALKHILGSFDGGGACRILNDIGEQVADGRVELGGKPNQDVSFPLPIGRIFSQRRAWLAKGAPPAESGFKDGNLTLTLLGDQAGPAAATAGHAGLFVVFAVTDAARERYTDDPEQNCPLELSSQWFAITNVGLTLQRSHSRIYVIARRLDTGAPIKNANIEFLSRSGVRLESQPTDEFGMAKIPAQIGRGTGGNALAAVVAYAGEDFAFLDMNGDAVDLSDRGFEGRVPPGDLDAFVAPARGIYRPGETIEALVLVRGPNGEAVERVPPLTAMLLRDDGSPAAQRPLSADEMAAGAKAGGGFLVTMRVSDLIREGSFTFDIRALGRSIGSAPVEVRYFQPHTVRITSEETAWRGSIDDRGVLDLKGKASAEYFYSHATPSGVPDAPAVNLGGSLEVRIEPAATPFPGCFADYTFGSRPGDARAQILRGTALSTDARGELNVALVREGVSGATVPLRATIKMSLLDLNGVAGDHKIDVPLRRPGQHWIGMRTHGPFTGGAEPSTFDFVVLDENNRPVETPVHVRVVREFSSFVWHKDGNTWDFVSQSLGTPMLVGAPFTASPRAPGARPDGCPESSSFPFRFQQTGSYVIEATDDSGARTELAVGVGFTTSPDGNLKPDALRVWTKGNKSEFAPGQTIEVGVDTPHRTGIALGELVIAGKVYGRFEAEIRERRAEGTLKVDENAPLGPAHIYVTAFRQAEDDSIARGPGRAIGTTMVRIAGDASAPPALAFVSPPMNIAPAAITDGTPVRIELATTGLDPDAFVTLAAVDEGVLTVTEFKTPDPVDFYFGKRRIDFDVFDTYGRILYGKYGYGDNTLVQPLQGVSFQPAESVIWHSPIVKTVDGRTIIEIPANAIPGIFQGQVRLMAWAWDGKRVAVKDARVTVRDSLSIRLAAPPFMAPDDTAMIPLRVSNLRNADTTSVQVNVSVAAPLELATGGTLKSDPCAVGEPVTECQRFQLEARMGAPPSVVLVPVRTKPNLRAAEISGAIRVSSTVSGQPVNKTWTIPIRTPFPRVTKVMALNTGIEPGASLSLGRDAFERALVRSGLRWSKVGLRLVRKGLLPTTDVAAGANEARNLDELAHILQLLTSDAELWQAGRLPAMSRDALIAELARLVEDISVLQIADGGFVTDSTYVKEFKDATSFSQKLSELPQTAFALDVLMRAQAAGIAVDPGLVDKAVGFMLTILRSIEAETDQCSRAAIYALEILARINRIEGASVRKIGERCGALVAGDATAKVMLAAAYGAYGFTEELAALLPAGAIDALGALDKNPAEAARAATLLLETQAAQIDPLKLLNKVSTGDAAQSATLQTISWFARANAAALAILEKERRPFRADAVAVAPDAMRGRALSDGLELKRIEPADVPAGGIRITNGGTLALAAAFVAEGVPERIGEANPAGFSVDVKVNGASIDPTRPIALKQFEPVYFTIEINQKGAYSGSQALAAVQVLPCGFEGIDKTFEQYWAGVLGNQINPRVFSQVGYAEFRGDRWITLPSVTTGPQHHLLAFSARPTLQGEFVLPPLVIRDLNNPDRIAWSAPARVVIRPN